LAAGQIVDGTHSRPGWPSPEELAQLLEASEIAFGLDFNRSVTAVPHPTAHA
jgi:hypothetical protein